MPVKCFFVATSWFRVLYPCAKAKANKSHYDLVLHMDTVCLQDTQRTWSSYVHCPLSYSFNHSLTCRGLEVFLRSSVSSKTLISVKHTKVYPDTIGKIVTSNFVPSSFKRASMCPWGTNKQYDHAVLCRHSYTILIFSRINGYIIIQLLLIKIQICLL